MLSSDPNLKHLDAEASSEDDGYRSTGSDSGSDSDSLDSTGPRKKRRTSLPPAEDSDDGDDSGVPFAPSRIASSFSAPSRITRNPSQKLEGPPVDHLKHPPTTVLAPTLPDTTFESLGVRPWLVQSLANMAIKRPTGIQKGCIPEILKGRDCIGGSRTGSGKTVAFAVPILQKWAEDPSAIFAVILTPTR